MSAWTTEALAPLVQKVGITKARHHIFLCVGVGKCAPLERAEAAWSHLKARLSELKLSDVHGQVLRSRAACLRVCTQGPIAVVYPSGTWYHSAHGENLDRIITEHLQHNRIVSDLVLVNAPLE
jgi:(2Fe-2S) ferredoxin